MWPLGVLSSFRKNPPLYLEAVVREFGDVVHLKLANQNAYVVSHPDYIREILVTQQNNFVKSRVLERARVLLGDGLLTSENEFHTRQRRLVQPAFHRDRLIRYASDMVACSVRTRDQYKPGECDIHEEMIRLTLAIVGQTLFSKDVSSDAEEIGGAIAEIFSLFNTLLLPFADIVQKLKLGPFRKFDRARAKLDRIVYGLIAERRASGIDTGDLLSMLLLARDEDDNARMTDQQVRDEALTLLIAGHETTANALTWAWYLLAQNPQAEAGWHRELDVVLKGRLPGFEDLPLLPYTTGVFSEALRLYPPAWAIGRKAKAAFQLGPYMIPAKSVLLTSPWIVHRDARWWPDPEKFDPLRWANTNPDTRPKFAFFPFGGGARVCIGERFAWSEGVLALATIAQRWKMRLVPGHPVVPQAVLTLRPKHGIRMRLEQR